MQIVEQLSSIPGLYDAGNMNSVCSAWNDFTASSALSQMGIQNDGV